MAKRLFYLSFLCPIVGPYKGDNYLQLISIKFKIFLKKSFYI